MEPAARIARVIVPVGNALAVLFIPLAPALSL
ncbi:MAG: hypothetical protein JWQ13_2454 [Ramlibacter sp.]|jgi:hypothetical protein|nr:hypothetical protein [Ramlibacter sp.]